MVGKQKTHGQMVEGSLGPKTRCFSKEERNAGFKAFKGHLMDKVKTLNFQPKQNLPDHTTRHDLSQVEVPGTIVNKPFKQDVTCTLQGSSLNCPVTAAGKHTVYE